MHRPFVMSCTWGGGYYRSVCKMLWLDSVGNTPPPTPSLHPLCTLVLKQQTLNHKPYALNPKPSTLNPKPSTLHQVGKIMPAVQDVSQLLQEPERLRVSPGGGDLSDGSARICVGQSDA